MNNCRLKSLLSLRRRCIVGATPANFAIRKRDWIVIFSRQTIDAAIRRNFKISRENLMSVAVPHVALIVETSLAHGRGILSGISQYLTAHGPWSMYVDQRKLNDAPPSWLEDWNGHGVIMRAQTRKIAEVVARLKVPAVDTLNHLRDLNVPAVLPDHCAVARAAVEHLAEREFRHFAFVGVDRATWSAHRRDAVCETLSSMGHMCHVYSPVSRRRFLESWEGGQQDLAEWLNGLPKPLGVIAAHDLRALCVLDACRRHGLAVPEQVAVIGVDNDEVLCNLGDPPLSSVQLDLERIGFEAAGLLEHLMKGKEPPATPIMIPPRGVVTRRSTDTVAIADAMIANAMRYIAEHACNSINVDKIAAHCGVSRRHMERSFTKLLGSSPNEQIARARLTRAKQLLVQTDFPLDVVAERCGFKHAAYLSVFFKKHVGQTPGDFRTTTTRAGSQNSAPDQKNARSSGGRKRLSQHATGRMRA
jgi:LacI family transcriptional regulator